MINLTEEELDSIPKISETEYLNETPIHIKFFLPGTDWRWYVTEAQRESDEEVIFFGFVQGQFNEWGYFSLTELQKVCLKPGIKVEKDNYFKDMCINNSGDIYKKEITA